MSIDITKLPGASAGSAGQTAIGGPLLALDRRLDTIFVNWAVRFGAVEVRFPPCIEARQLDRLGYFQAFPHLATFPVVLQNEPDNLSAFTARPGLAEDTPVQLSKLADVEHVLTPAACYPVYIEFENHSFDQPCYITTRATCFRREQHFQHLERQWAFSMREIVCIGTEAEVQRFLTAGTDLLQQLAQALDLPVCWQTATDPFFKPKQNAQYVYQKLEPVKNELVYDTRLAIASTNFHRQHFGAAFNLQRADDFAYSGCIAMGIERWLAAVGGRWGYDPLSWPSI